ncbi:MAG: LolA family protein [Sciscionella sp.]
MDSKKVTLGVAGTGVLAGVVGLAVLAAPAGAGPAPSLPNVSPQALVQSVLTAKPAALNGTVEIDNQLGLPALPGMSELASGKTDMQVATDGKSKGKLSLPQDTTEQETVVDNGKTIWVYDSAKRSATRYTLPSKGTAKHEFAKHKGAEANPASIAKRTITAMRKTSTVTVDGTTTVAGRDAYQLVLTPKPNEKTLLRQVRVSIDSQTRMPLRLDVYGNGSADPVLGVGFTSLNLGPQDPASFSFTPPAGVKVVDGNAKAKSTPDPQRMSAGLGALDINAIGHGWDTVVTGKVPAGMLSGKADRSGQGGTDPMRLLSRFGKHVSGTWGEGWIVHAKIANVLITSDGRVAAGFVPQQVLTHEIGTVK